MCVRSLRTQQRTESQCHFVLALGLLAALVVVRSSGARSNVVHIVVSNLRAFARVWDCDRVSVAGFGWWWRVSLFLLTMTSRGLVYMHSMESLILAQDERWRRA